MDFRRIYPLGGGARKRFPLCAHLAALLSIVVSSAQQAPSLQSGDVLTVGVSDQSPVLTTIPEAFVGATFYYSNLHKFTGREFIDANPAFVRLLNHLGQRQGPAQVRLGGGTVNSTWYNPNGANPPSGIETELTPEYLQVIRQALEGANTKGIFCLNVGHNDLDLFQDMGLGILNHVDESNIAAFELGNEPNRYGPKGLRPSGYDFDDFSDEFADYLGRYLTNVSATIPAFGPTLTLIEESVDLDPEWNARAPEFIDRFHNSLGAYSLNRYPLSDCTGSKSLPRYASISNLLKERASIGQGAAIQSSVDAATSAGLPFYILEDNSASCGGTPGVSDTLASALWFVDSAFAYASAGVDKVFVSFNPSGHYSPFYFDRAFGPTSISYTPRVFPIYYGMLMFAETVGTGSELTDISVNRAGNTNAWATKDSVGTIRVALINKDLNASGNARVYVPGSTEPATLARLSGPGVTAKEGIIYAGQTFDGSTDGDPSGQRSTTIIQPDGTGTYTISLSSASAALLTIGPSDNSSDVVAANAGPDQNVSADQTVTLDGSLSFGNIVSFQWNQVSGQPVSLSNASSTKSSFTPTEPGSYAFELTVNGATSTSTDETVVTVTSAPPSNEGAILEAGGIVAFEAEAPSFIEPGIGKFINHTWAPTNDSASSEGQFMICTPDNATNAKLTSDGPALAYRIQFTNSGTYKVHARMKSPNSASDTLHLGLDEPISLPYGIKQKSSSWKWTDQVVSVGPAEIQINSVGTHVFRIWPREDGCQVDRIVLAKTNVNPDAVPNSTRDGSSDPPPDDDPPPPDDDPPPPDDGPSDGNVFVENAGVVAFESEHASSLEPGVGKFSNHAWQISNGASASLSQFMVCLPDSGANAKLTSDGPALVYDILFSTPGVYDVHVRMQRQNSSSDTIHLGLESPITYPYGMKQSSSSWGWIQRILGADDATINITSPGPRKLRVWPREDGCEIDRIVLSTNPNIDPDSVPNSTINNSLGATSQFRATRTLNASLAVEDLFVETMTAAGLTGAQATPEAIPFGDNISNLVKYAFNMDLTTSDAKVMKLGGDSGLPIYEIHVNGEGQTVVQVEFVQRKDGGMIYTPMLGTSPDDDSFVPMTGARTLTNLNEGWDLIRITEICAPEMTRLFGRVEVALR